VGYDRVDVPAATARNVVVTITPTSNHEAVAELTLALLFAVTKSVVRNDRAVRAGQWPRQLLLPVRGQKLGILGLGRIGQSVARRAAALGMRVLATESQPDRAFIDQHGVALMAFDDLLAESDVVSVHCPLNEATRGLFNRRTLQRMKSGSIFLNTARGGLVHEPDLVEALTHGPLYGAGLDVFAVEPPAEENPLLALDNVVVSPHLAGADERSMVAMGVEAADCIIRLYRGQWPTGAVVNDQLQDRWRW
jgi:D-3-phosphoglycerate dehydrogenase / 2-oxoglutarate reductase